MGATGSTVAICEVYDLVRGGGNVRQDEIESVEFVGREGGGVLGLGGREGVAREKKVRDGSSTTRRKDIMVRT